MAACEHRHIAHRIRTFHSMPTVGRIVTRWVSDIISLRFNFPYWLRHAVHYSSTVQFVRDGTDEWLSESNAWHNSDMPCVDGGERDCLPTNSDWLSRFKIHHISHHPIRLNSIHATLFFHAAVAVCALLFHRTLLLLRRFERMLFGFVGVFSWVAGVAHAEVKLRNKPNHIHRQSVSHSAIIWCQPSCTPACICCFSSLDFTFLSSLASIMFVSLAINLNPIELGRDIAYTRQSSATYRHVYNAAKCWGREKSLFSSSAHTGLVWDVGVWWRVKEFVPWCLTWEFTFNSFLYFPRLTQHFEHKFVLFMRFPLVCFSSSPAPPSPLTLCCC